MRQISLQLKTRIPNTNFVSDGVEVQKAVLHTMLAILGGLALLYVLILGNIVFNVTQRKSLEKEVLALSAEVRDLESSYLAVLDSIDNKLSSAMGFKEIKATFVTQQSLGYNFSGANSTNDISGRAFDKLRLANNEI